MLVSRLVSENYSKEVWNDIPVSGRGVPKTSCRLASSYFMPRSLGLAPAGRHWGAAQVFPQPAHLCVLTPLPVTPGRQLLRSRECGPEAHASLCPSHLSFPSGGRVPGCTPPWPPRLAAAPSEPSSLQSPHPGGREPGPIVQMAHYANTCARKPLSAWARGDLHTAVGKYPIRTPSTQCRAHGTAQASAQARPSHSCSGRVFFEKRLCRARWVRRLRPWGALRTTVTYIDPDK